MRPPELHFGDVDHTRQAFGWVDSLFISIEYSDAYCHAALVWVISVCCHIVLHHPCKTLWLQIAKAKAGLCWLELHRHSCKQIDSVSSHGLWQVQVSSKRLWPVRASNGAVTPPALETDPPRKASHTAVLETNQLNDYIFWPSSDASCPTLTQIRVKPKYEYSLHGKIPTFTFIFIANKCWVNDDIPYKHGWRCVQQHWPVYAGIVKEIHLKILYEVPGRISGQNGKQRITSHTTGINLTRIEAMQTCWDRSYTLWYQGVVCTVLEYCLLQLSVDSMSRSSNICWLELQKEDGRRCGS